MADPKLWGPHSPPVPRHSQNPNPSLPNTQGCLAFILEAGALGLVHKARRFLRCSLKAVVCTLPFKWLIKYTSWFEFVHIEESLPLFPGTEPSGRSGTNHSRGRMCSVSLHSIIFLSIPWCDAGISPFLQKGLGQHHRSLSHGVLQINLCSLLSLGACPPSCSSWQSACKQPTENSGIWLMTKPVFLRTLVYV